MRPQEKRVCSHIGLEETLTEATDSPLYLTIKSRKAAGQQLKAVKSSQKS